ncbi:RICIN domain-containing protein [Streptomyces chrestomyceticus]|uniref:RICIN domain-containing protein n=1 Tax=Streptomyces chrestomyceticus TaxID=68185 RepID=UPI0019D26D98|nr:RICIN domain-containing protein [Streptomyces chrestomyceticus]
MKKRLIGTVAATAVLAPALMFSASGQAFAATKTVTWKNKGNGKCLVASGFWVGVGDCGPAAKWKETKQSDGTFVLKSADHGFCLDSKKDGSVRANVCNGGKNQKWREIKDSLGWRLQNKATGLTLGSKTSAGSPVYAGFDGGIKHQRWS